MRKSFDVVVIGGGLVGAAIAWGCAKSAQVALLDGPDVAHRASRANNGQIWIQGKGFNFPDYASLTQRSGRMWKAFAEEIEAVSKIDVEFSQPGGLAFCLTEAELDDHASMIRRLEAAGINPDTQILSPEEAQKLVPLTLGRAVMAATYCPHDATVNPMKMMRALQMATVCAGGDYWPDSMVREILPDGAGFRIKAGDRWISAGKVVISAGLGSRDIAAAVGLAMPVWPYQGQLIITERIERLAPFLTAAVRQTADGTIQIGTSRENTGFETAVKVETLQTMARRATACIPAIGSLSMVRSWGCLRIMPPDGFPIYEESAQFPGAFAVTCHSGVTLAAVHGNEIAPAVLSGTINQRYAPYSARRFDAQPIN